METSYALHYKANLHLQQALRKAAQDPRQPSKASPARPSQPVALYRTCGKLESIKVIGTAGGGTISIDHTLESKENKNEIHVHPRGNFVGTRWLTKFEIEAGNQKICCTLLAQNAETQQNNPASPALLHTIQTEYPPEQRKRRSPE